MITSLNMYSNTRSFYTLLITCLIGTTFRRQIIWLVANNADVETAKKEMLRYRVPHLDRYNTEEGDKTSTEIADDLESPRLLFTHLPYR